MAKALGVIAEPEVSIFSLPTENQQISIALASDGIWDVFSNNEFIERVN